MGANDWIKIEPGCRMPKDGERVLVADGMACCEAKLRGLGWYLESGCRVTPTHWMPIVPPAPEPDACARWLDCEGVTDPMCRNWAREGWNAALEHARRDNARMP